MSLIDHVRTRYRLIADFEDHGCHETIDFASRKSDAAASARQWCEKHGEPVLVEDHFTGRSFVVRPPAAEAAMKSD